MNKKLVLFTTETTVIPQSFNAGINELFENVERKFGHILVSHAVRYVCLIRYIFLKTFYQDSFIILERTTSHLSKGGTE